VSALQIISLMAKENVITKDSFDALLSWLDGNRDSAGQKYEKIRTRLISIFRRRGCFEAEELADETISRVTVKVSHIAGNYVGEPALYFYGVADNVHREWLKKQKKVNHLEFVEREDYGATHPGGQNPQGEVDFQCLESCLGALSKDQRALIIEYYQGEKREKIERRKELGKQLGISEAALQIRASRIRATLRGCVERCVAAGNA
jgi:RNA polymerase sigma factor (sigma-70 family)